MPYLFIAALFWGTSFIAGKLAYPMADPALVVLLRLVLASAVTLPFSIYYIKRYSINLKLALQIAGLGLITYPLTFLLQFIGLKYTSAASAAAMIGVEPFIIMLIGYFCFKEKATLAMWLLAIVTFCGVTLIAGLSSSHDISLLGCLIVLSSTILVAFSLHWTQILLSKINAQALTILTIQLGTLSGLPFMALATQHWTLHHSWQGWLAIIYLGIGCSLIAGWLWNKGLQLTSANISGILLALEPVFGVCFSLWLLGETLNTTTSLGILLVVLSATTAMLLPKHQAA